jgi:hypothetical protein
MTTTTADPDVTLATALQARVLGVLVDGRVWSRDELAEQLAEDVEACTPDFGATLSRTIDGLVEAGLAHRVNRELIAASRLGMLARQGVDPGDGQALRVPDSGDGVGVVERVDDPDAGDRLAGGAEGLPGRLDTARARE